MRAQRRISLLHPWFSGNDKLVSLHICTSWCLFLVAYFVDHNTLTTQIVTKGMIVNNQLQLYSFCYFIVFTNARMLFSCLNNFSSISVVCVMMAIQQKHQLPFTSVYQLCSYLYACFLLKQLITFSLYSLARISFAASKRSLWPLHYSSLYQ